MFRQYVCSQDVGEASVVRLDEWVSKVGYAYRAISPSHKGDILCSNQGKEVETVILSDVRKTSDICYLLGGLNGYKLTSTMKQLHNTANCLMVTPKESGGPKEARSWR